MNEVAYGIVRAATGQGERPKPPGQAQPNPTATARGRRVRWAGVRLQSVRQVVPWSCTSWSTTFTGRAGRSPKLPVGFHTTPEMAAGVADDLWKVEDLVGFLDPARLITAAEA